MLLSPEAAALPCLVCEPALQTPEMLLEAAAAATSPPATEAVGREEGATQGSCLRGRPALSGCYQDCMIAHLGEKSGC